MSEKLFTHQPSEEESYLSYEQRPIEGTPFHNGDDILTVANRGNNVKPYSTELDIEKVRAEVRAAHERPKPTPLHEITAAQSQWLMRYREEKLRDEWELAA